MFHYMSIQYKDAKHNIFEALHKGTQYEEILLVIETAKYRSKINF
jgi:hypothetical protein